MNEVNFNGYTEKELNMFFSLVFLAKDKGLTKLIIPFSELKELADRDKNRDRFIKNLLNINKKLVKLNQTIEKAKNNRFLTKLLTIDNIEKLLKIFEENDLIKGLLWAYKEVRQDISTLEYLIKAIKTGIEKKRKKL